MRTQPAQGRFGLPPLAQDHKVIGVGHEPRAKALFKPELLPSQHKPAHVKIGQQWSSSPVGRFLPRDIPATS